MGKVRRAGLAALFWAAALAAPAAARELTTEIDLDYTYSQENFDGDVEAATEYNQKYQIKYETSLTSAYDFLGAVTLELEDDWYTDDYDASVVKPTLELQAKGVQGAAKVVYEGDLTSIDAYQEDAATEIASSNLTAELEVIPLIWPEVRVKYQRRRDVQDWFFDALTETYELTVRKDIDRLRLELNVTKEDISTSLPGDAASNRTEWMGKATYKEVLWGGTEFELAYEVEESYETQETGGVASSPEQEYDQQLKTRLKNSLQLTPLATLGLSWEYELNQDLLELEYDYETKNKYKLELRWDLVHWARFTTEATRESESSFAALGEDDEQKLTDTVKLALDLAPYTWLRVTGKAEFKNEGQIVELSGTSLDQTDEDKYEINLKNRFGDFWDLTLNASETTKHEDGWLAERETKVKAEPKMRFWNLVVTPTYEVTRKSEWEWGFDTPSAQSQIRDGKLKLEYRLQLVDMLTATFTHEYGVKCEDELDEVLNFERTLQLNEDTKLNLVIAEIIRDLRLEGEVERKATDTEEDAEPMLVEVSYALKLDWKFDELSLASTFKYNDKGNTDDDVSFNTKVTWKSENLELTGEYQFDKIYAELTDEKRKLNLKLNYKF